jgi:hypothetical protein
MRPTASFRSSGVFPVLLALATAACTPAPPRNGSPATPRPALVRLSADAAAEDAVQRCLANPLGSVARYTDNEAYAAADRRNPDRVIVVWQTQSGSGSVVQWSRSLDGGGTWSAPRAAPINACAGGPVAGATRASDPWAAFGPDGRAYVSALAWTANPDDGPDLVSALVVVASPDGGSTWETPVAAAVAPSGAIAHDNLGLTADPTRAGTIYATTTRAETVPGVSYFGRLGLTRSDDGGRTWSPIRSITEAVNRERIGAPQTVVDPRSGRVYAVYHRRRRGAESVIGVMASSDAGETWSAESVAAVYVPGEEPRHPATGRPFVLAGDIVQAAVSPATGQLVIAYADARRAPGGRLGVSLVWSVDGARWSEPIAVSDSGSQTAWLPAVAAGANGEIGVSYYQASFAPGEPRAQVMLHRFRAGEGGLEPIGRAILDETGLEWPGDYHGLVAIRTGFLAAYGRESDITAVRGMVSP